MKTLLVRALAGATSIIIGACSTLPEPATPSAMPALDADAANAAWARVLERHVDGHGRIDFVGLSAQPNDLNRYVAYVFRNGPETTPASFPTPADRLSYHINAYNALAMYNVIHSGFPADLDSGLAKFDFFYLTRFDVDGTRTNLYDYENDVIRRLGDPRIHFALNCMARACPRLPQAPFGAGDLDAELEREARFFFSEARNLRVDHDERAVYLSAILDFFTEDFLAVSPSLIAYVNRYAEPAVPEDYDVRFIPYDWTINAQPAADG